MLGRSGKYQNSWKRSHPLDYCISPSLSTHSKGWQNWISLTLERINRSLLGFLGSWGLYFIVWKNSTDIISAALQHDVGWLQIKANAELQLQSLAISCFYNEIPVWPSFSYQWGNVSLEACDENFYNLSLILLPISYTQQGSSLVCSWSADKL